MFIYGCLINYNSVFSFVILHKEYLYVNMYIITIQVRFLLFEVSL
jgi:hypothetical protein